jgi:hypothetical protein
MNPATPNKITFLSFIIEHLKALFCDLAVATCFLENVRLTLLYLSRSIMTWLVQKFIALFLLLFRADSAALLNLLENNLGRSKPAIRLMQTQ